MLTKQEFFEKPVDRKFVDKVIKYKGWHQSMFTLDCILASKRFSEQARVFMQYPESSLLVKKFIVDKRNANAYRWNALEIAKLETMYHIHFYEDSAQILKFSQNDSGTMTLKYLASMAVTLHKQIADDLLILPLAGSDYGLSTKTIEKAGRLLKV